MLNEFFGGDWGTLNGKTFSFNDNNAYPFMWLNGTLKIGKPKNIHRQLAKEFLSDYGVIEPNAVVSRGVVWELFKQNFGDSDVPGRIWDMRDLGFEYDAIITLWNDSAYDKNLFKLVCNRMNIDFNKVIYVTYNEEIIWIATEDVEFVSDSEEKKVMQQIHLMNQKDKREKLQDFRNNRDEKNGKMLGNMTMAQYHSLIRQECKTYLNKIIKENVNDEILEEWWDYDEDNDGTQPDSYILSAYYKEKLLDEITVNTEDKAFKISNMLLVKFKTKGIDTSSEDFNMYIDGKWGNDTDTIYCFENGIWMD